MWALSGGKDMVNETVLQEALQLAKDTGYEGIEIRIETVSQLVQEKSINYVRNLFSKAKIVPAGWELPGAYWRGDYKYSWRSDEKRYQQLMEKLPLFAKVSHDLGCKRSFTWPVSFSDEMDYEENFRFHVTRLKPIVNILKDYNLRLGLEWMAPKTCRIGHKYEFIYDMKGALILTKAIDKENVGLLLDSWHWYHSHGTLEDIKSLKPEQVIYVHFNDAPKGIPMDEMKDLERAVPGETGVIDCIGFLKALKEIGYDGPIEPAAIGARSVENKSVLEAAKIYSDVLTRLFHTAGILER
jgi:sugar phosphate isomerase/epimerase